MIDWLKSFLSGLAATAAAFLSGYITGWRRQETSALKQEIKAHEDREKIEDNLSPLSADDKRLRLSKWVRGFPSDPP